MANISYLATDIDETITKAKEISPTATEINNAVNKVNDIQSTASEIDEAVQSSKAGGKSFISGVIELKTPASVSTSYGTGLPISTTLTFTNPIVITSFCNSSLIPAFVNGYFQPTPKILTVSIYNADGLSPNTTYRIGYLITEATN